MQKSLRIVRDFILFLIFLTVLGIFFIYLTEVFGSPQNFAKKIQDFGMLGPLVIILLISLEVVVAPIPGAVIAIVSGFAFGAVWGTLFSYIGNVIGTAIAFQLSRSFGRPLVEHLVNKRKLEVYDCFFQEHGRIMLWMAYIFPVFPSDIVSFITGLSDIKFKRFMVIVSIGYLPNMFFLNHFGSNLMNFGTDTLVSGSILISLFIFGSLFYLHLKKKASC